jgi:hypothetical protein
VVKAKLEAKPLNELLKVLNDYTGALMVLLTATYVFFTGAMVVASLKSIKAARDQSWWTSRAYVVLRLVFREQMVLAFEVTNEGKTPARMLKLTLDRDIFEFGERDKRVNDFPMFSTPIAAFPAGSKCSFSLWLGTVKLGGDLYPAQFTVTATYESLGRSVTEETALSAEVFREFPPLTVEESLHKVTKDMNEVKETLKKMCWQVGEFMHRQR